MNRKWIVTLLGGVLLSSAALAEDKKVEVATTATIEYPSQKKETGVHTKPGTKAACPVATHGVTAQFYENKVVLNFRDFVVRGNDSGVGCDFAVPLKWNQAVPFRPTNAHIRGVHGITNPSTSFDLGTYVYRFYSGSGYGEQQSLSDYTKTPLATYGQSWKLDKWMGLANPAYFQILYDPNTPALAAYIEVSVNNSQDPNEWVRIDSIEYNLEWQW